MKKLVKKAMVNVIVSLMNEVAESDHGLNLAIEFVGADVRRLSNELAAINKQLSILIDIVSEPRPKPRRRSKKRIVKDEIDYSTLN